MKAEDLKYRLLSGYLLFGLFNLLVVTVFIYFEVRETLIERSSAHMTSVKTLARQKLNLYLESIKIEANEFPGSLVDKNVVEKLCLIEKLRLISQKGDSCMGLDAGQFRHNVFTPFQSNFFVLKTSHDNGTLLWVFNHAGLTEILNQRTGLGESGETYLVGPDHAIKSASRFIEEWSSVKIWNEAVDKGLNGAEGTSIVEDYRNVRVISSFINLEKDRLKFVLLSEIDLQEVLSPLTDAILKLFSLGIILVLLNLQLAVLTTKRMLAKVTEMRNKINQLTRQTIRIQEEERERIAYNLHDSVGQYLTALKWGLSHLNLEMKDDSKGHKVRELEKLSEVVIQEVRAVSHDIMPSLIKDFTCFHAIREYLSTQRKLHDLSINYSWDDKLDEIPYIQEFRVNLYRMVQELFQNALKHSKATVLDLNFILEKNHLIMVYSDNGIGMDKDAALPRSLNYRAQLYNGLMERVTQDRGLKFHITFDLTEVTDGRN